MKEWFEGSSFCLESSSRPNSTKIDKNNPTKMDGGYINEGNHHSLSSTWRFREDFLLEKAIIDSLSNGQHRDSSSIFVQAVDSWSETKLNYVCDSSPYLLQYAQSKTVMSFSVKSTRRFICDKFSTLIKRWYPISRGIQRKPFVERHNSANKPTTTTTNKLEKQTKNRLFIIVT